MRNLLRSFAILDLISLVFLAMQLWVIVETYAASGTTGFPKDINGWLMFPMFWIILVGTYGLFFQKRFGYILYYVQFPLRLLLWIFSVGFVTLIPEALSYYGSAWFDPLLKLCFVAEFVRLYLTIRAHMGLEPF